MILNLGAGKKIRVDSINVDIIKYPGIDMAFDLEEYPWPWENESVDGIYLSHILEHFPDQDQFIGECYRILKPGGFLRIAAPHSSCVSSIGHFGHYRTYCYNAFDDFLSQSEYIFGKPLFKTVEKRINWWYEEPDAEEKLPEWMIPILKFIDKIVSTLANRVPRFVENVICPTIQFREVIWKGIKL